LGVLLKYKKWFSSTKMSLLFQYQTATPIQRFFFQRVDTEFIYYNKQVNITHSKVFFQRVDTEFIYYNKQVNITNPTILLYFNEIDTSIYSTQNNQNSSINILKVFSRKSRNVTQVKSSVGIKGTKNGICLVYWYMEKCVNSLALLVL